MYKDYYIEMGSEVFESECGWASFIISGDECYIENIYIKPEFRKTKKASSIADEISLIAKERGCKYLTGSTNTKKPSVERSIQVILGYGFKYLKSNDSAIWYYKEL
jgi:hypothetical protein